MVVVKKARRATRMDIFGFGLISVKVTVVILEIQFLSFPFLRCLNE